MGVDTAVAIGYAVGMAKIAKSEIVVGLLVATTRYSDVLVLSLPKARLGLVRIQVMEPGRTFETEVPWQALRWT